ncbi:MAG: MerR family transcriptional regulator [candidate division Zixibacteria bacterium]|nr:MerR family transcriptional regulator [candidate division Zixibacteria bacterium]
MKTIGEVSEHLGVRSHQVRYLIRSGQFNPEGGRAGGRWMFTARDMKRLGKIFRQRKELV